MNLKEKKNNENKKLSKQLEQEESEKWTSHGGISVGRERGTMGGGNVQGIRSIIGRHKIVRGKLRIV